MIPSPLNDTVVETIRSAARKLTGSARRAFPSEACHDYCNRSARTAERIFGWSRHTVQKELDEQAAGTIIPDQERSRRPSYSAQLPTLQDDIRSLVDQNGNSRETSDFLVNGLEHQWRYRKKHYSGITPLQIDLDNGPELESGRTQFIKRMVEFADRIQLELVYYPLPLRQVEHSKYSPVEHCWGVLECHWSGALLTDLEVVRGWTKSMRWAGIAPNVYVLEGKYHRGVTLTKKEMKTYEQRLVRTVGIEKMETHHQTR